MDFKFPKLDAGPSPQFSPTNAMELVPGTPMHPLYDLTLLEEQLAAIPPPLFAGQANRPSRALPVPAIKRLRSAAVPPPIFTGQVHRPPRDLSPSAAKKPRLATIPQPVSAGQASRPPRVLPPAATTHRSAEEPPNEIDKSFTRWRFDSAATDPALEERLSQLFREASRPLLSPASRPQSFDLWPTVRLDVLAPIEGLSIAEDSPDIRSHGSLSVLALDGSYISQPSVSIDAAIPDQLTDHQTESGSHSSDNDPDTVPIHPWDEPPIIEGDRRSFDRRVAEDLTKYRLNFGRRSSLGSPPVSPKTIPATLNGYGTYVKPEYRRPKKPLPKPGVALDEVSHPRKFF